MYYITKDPFNKHLWKKNGRTCIHARLSVHKPENSSYAEKPIHIKHISTAALWQKETGQHYV